MVDMGWRGKLSHLSKEWFNPEVKNATHLLFTMDAQVRIAEGVVCRGTGAGTITPRIVSQVPSAGRQ